MSLRDQLRDLVLSETSNYEYIMSLVKADRPKYLYKYASFNEYWKDLIFNGKVRMQAPTSFNDPFDTSFYCDFEMYKNSLEIKIKNRFPYINKMQIDSMAKLKISSPNEMNHGFKNIMLISCFSEINTSILMWSHYARKHSGFCIEYKVDRLNDFCADRLYPVIYSDKLCDMTDYMISDAKQNLTFKSIAPVLFKSTEWEYEKEWRLISTCQTDNIEDFSNGISAIYLGVNVFNDDNNRRNVEELLHWAKERHIKIFKMFKSNRYYRLNYKKMHL